MILDAKHERFHVRLAIEADAPRGAGIHGRRREPQNSISKSD
jgi:hypothetical protein